MTISAYPFRTSLSKLAIAITTLSLTCMTMAAETIKTISVSHPNTDNTVLSVNFSNQPVQPTAYQLDNPSRLVLDFPKVNHQLAKRVQTFNQGNVQDVTTLNSDDMTRMIITLKQDATFTTQVKDNQLLINMIDKTPVVTAATPTVVNTAPVVVATTPVQVTPVQIAPVTMQTPVIVTPSTPVVVEQPPIVETAPVIVTPPAPVPVVDTHTPSVMQAPTNTMVVKVNPL